MGAYLSKPICDKESEDYAGDIMRVGASAMQGWRMSQEDAHCCLLQFDGDTNTSLFAVYDGHGGCDVAKYTAANFPEFLKSVPAYKEGRLATALEDAFLGFDATLVQQDVKLQLAQLAAGTDGVEDEEDNEEENNEEAQVLREEATMPIEQLLERYGGGGVLGSRVIAGLKKPTKNLSPVIRAKPGSGAEAVSADVDGNTETGSDDGVRVKLADKIVNGFREDEVDDAADDPASTSESPAVKTDSKPLPSSDAVGSSEPTVAATSVTNGNGKQDSAHECDKLTGNGVPSQPAEGSEAEAAEPSKSSSGTECVSGNCGAVDTRQKPETELASEASSSSGNAGGSSSGNTGSSSGNASGSSGNTGSSSGNASGSSASSTTGTTSVSESAAASSSTCSSAVKEAAEPCSSTSSTSCDIPSGPCSSSAGTAAGSSCTASSSNPAAAAEGAADSVPSSSAGPSSSKPTESSEDETSEDEEGEDSDDELEEWNADAADSDSDEDDDEVDDEDDEEDAEEEEDEDDAEELEPGMEFGDEPGTDSGCTAVVALLRDNELHVANAGDSRCVLCRDGTAVEMSVDHKPEDALEHERILKAGGRVTCDGRVNGGLNLSRALGDHAYKKNTLISDREQMITALPDVKSLVIDERDEFMVIACDGIWNVMSSQDVVNFVRTRIQSGTTKLSAICEEMFDFCLAPDTSGDGTGCDNMTCVIVSFRGLTSGVATRTRNKRKTSGDDDDTANDSVADESTVAAKRLKDGD